MHVVVTRLFEAGRPIPRWRLAGLKSIAGDLAHGHVRLDRISRPIPCLRLLCPELRSIDLLDPRLADVAGDGMTFGGFELGGSGDQYLAQTWQVHFTPPA